MCVGAANGAFGLRALFKRPRGVEEAVIEAVGEEEAIRRAGRRGRLVASSGGLEGD